MYIVININIILRNFIKFLHNLILVYHFFYQFYHLNNNINKIALIQKYS